MRANCGCDFTADRLTDRVFICNSDSPQSVIYEAQLHGTLQANASRLLSIFEEWISSDARSIPVQLSRLEIGKICVISSDTQSSCGTTTASTFEGNNSVGAIIGGLLAIVSSIIIISIVVICFVIFRRRKKSLTSKKEPK